MPKRINLKEGAKKLVAGDQYKCANKPESNIIGLENYDCPLWKDPDNPGSFDKSSYNIDHIIEYAIGGTNDIDNLQALCISCHAVKTKVFVSITLPEIRENIMEKVKDVVIVVENKPQETICSLKYNCETCNYSTDVHCNFQKHVNSKKHKEKLAGLIDIKILNDIDTSPILNAHHKSNIKNEYICAYCNNMYSSQTSLSRHRHACSNKKTTVYKEVEKEKDVVINTLTEKISHLYDINKKNEDIIKTKDQAILLLTQENNTLKTLLKKSGILN